MSTFDGVIKEYPLISIDNFLEDSKNFQSTVFFLSHCHTDHMNGLRDKKFFELLESRGFSHIYMSDVSEHLLKNDDIFSHLSKYLVSLPIEQPTIIDIYDGCGVVCSRIVVTLLTAGHCPGSVMFLIEGERGRVLYTGDFRLPVGGSARLPNLHDETGRLKPLCSLYIDTTFCSDKCLYIPTREQCLVEILKLVEEWLQKGPDYIVRFICPAQYNYEFVFVEIFKKLGEKTHVFENKLKKYKGIKVIEDAVTSVATEARVHACISGSSADFKEILYLIETPCGYQTVDWKPIKVRLIKPSAMFFQRNSYSELSTFDYNTKVHRVCFSTHSSLDEIRDMVKYLKPKRVYPNVVARGTTADQILHLIGAPYWEYPDFQSPLGCLRNDINQGDSISSSNSLPFFDDCYKISHLPQKLDESSNHDVLPSAVEEAFNTRQINTYESPLGDTKTSIPLNASPEPLNNNSEPLNNSNVPSNDNATALVKPNCDNASPVEWECPILSSDDENYDPNGSFDSVKDKSDSDACATSEEQTSLEHSEECFSAVKPRLPKPEPPFSLMSISIEKDKGNLMLNTIVSKLEQPVFPTDRSAKKEKSFSTVNSMASKSELSVEKINISSGIRFELEKLWASQESSTICSTNSECKASQFEQVSLNSLNASCTRTPNQCQLAYSIGDSKITCNSKDQCDRKNTSNPVVNLEKSNSSHKKLVCSNLVNSQKLESKSSAFQSHFQTLGHDISSNAAGNKAERCFRPSELSHSKNSYNIGNELHTIQMDGEPSWRQSKLILDINELSSSASDVKHVFSKQNSAQSVEIANKKLNVSDATEQIKPSIKQIIAGKNSLKKSSASLDILDDSTFSKQNNIRLSQVSNFVAQTVNGNSYTIKSAQNKKSLSIKNKHSNFSLSGTQSQTFSTVGASMSTLTKKFVPSSPHFSKKRHDPFASKYEKSLIKPQKKEPASGHLGDIIDDDDVSILSCQNKCDKVVELIDLSSDDYDSEVELFNCAELDAELTLPVQNGQAIQSENQVAITVDSVEEDDSPSLLAPKKSRNETVRMTSCGSLNPGRKRKSADMDSFTAKKSPHVDSFSICDVESSPDDFLPFTHSQVSAYLNKI